MSTLHNLAARLTDRRRTALALGVVLAVALAIAIVVAAAFVPDAALAQQVNSGNADFESGISDAQALGVGLIGLAAIVILAVLVIKKNWTGVLVCCVGAAFAIMFADDPTGTITSAVVSLVELVTGQGGG